MDMRFMGATLMAMVATGAPAYAAVMNGTFIAMINGGTDTSGVFGQPGSDLTGDLATGTFSYDTSLLTASSNGTENYGTSTGSGALTATIKINNLSHTFSDVRAADNTSANPSVYVETSGPQVGYNTVDSAGSISETFSLSAFLSVALDAGTNPLTQTYTDTSPTDLGSAFTINDNGGSQSVSGVTFTVESISLSQQADVVPTPEPASLAILGLGFVGLAAFRSLGPQDPT